MSNPIEIFRSARQRIYPEGLLFSAAVTATSPFVLTPASAGLTFIIHQVTKETEPNVTKLAAAGAIGILSAISIAVETKALESHKYCASPTSSSFYILTGRPLISAICGHLVNYAQISILNPINLYAVATKDLGLLIESEGAAALTLAAWLITMNALVLKGKTRPFVNKVKQVREVLGEKLKR